MYCNTLSKDCLYSTNYYDAFHVCGQPAGNWPKAPQILSWARQLWLLTSCGAQLNYLWTFIQENDLLAYSVSQPNFEHCTNVSQGKQLQNPQLEREWEEIKQMDGSAEQQRRNPRSCQEAHPRKGRLICRTHENLKRVSERTSVWNHRGLWLCLYPCFWLG